MMITAVVPVKGNSSRLPGKNSLPFADSNLLQHKLEQLDQVDEIGRVLVSSDSPNLLRIASELGYESILRPKQFADESRPFSEFVRYVAKIVGEGHVLWSCVTSPMVGPKDYRRGIKEYLSAVEVGFDSLITVTPFKHYLMEESGPLNFKTGNLHVNSQELPHLELYTNGIVLAPVQGYMDWGYNWGGNPWRMELEQFQGIDIDTEADYVAAQAFFKHYGHLL